MRSEGTHDAVPLFGGYSLTAGEARRAIQIYSGATVIWEWRVGAPEREYRAGVAIRTPAGGGWSTAVGYGKSPAAALEDLLWRLAVPVLVAGEAAQAAESGEACEADEADEADEHEGSSDRQ
jgi:hypothetical protein